MPPGMHSKTAQLDISWNHMKSLLTFGALRSGSYSVISLSHSSRFLCTDLGLGFVQQSRQTLRYCNVADFVLWQTGEATSGSIPTGQRGWFFLLSLNGGYLGDIGRNMSSSMYTYCLGSSMNCWCRSSFRYFSWLHLLDKSTLDSQMTS